jgi:phosphatidate cytidylyltransferase
VGSDTAAYFFGRWFGRTPLAPSISPKKTVEGMISGLLVGAVLAGIDLALIGRLTWATLGILAIGPILAVLGDLAESALKRRYNIKDSHLAGLDIIPGHGGVLDRVDSLLFVVPFVVGYLALTGLL